MTRTNKMEAPKMVRSPLMIGSVLLGFALMGSVASGGQPDAVPVAESASAFLSPDKRYEATLVRSSAEADYEIRDAKSGHTFRTDAQYTTTPNEVKAGAFSRDSKKFGAAYHYGHSGGYTWIGIWSVETGERVGEKIVTGFSTDVNAVFEKGGE